jgi:hypothetical protein
MEERTSPVAPAERPPAGDRSAGDGSVPGGPPHLADPRVLTILTTEHWSLLSQRSLSWTESFSRAGMFLATLSAATVALALAGSIVGDEFLVFALVILPVVLFIGLATAIRLSQANVEDTRALHGMNRIRHAYLEMVPDLAPYFVMSQYDDLAGVMVSSGAPPGDAAKIGQPTLGSVLGGFLHGFVTTMGMVMVINCVIAGVIAGLVATALGAGVAGAVTAGLFGAAFLLVLQAIWGLRFFQKSASWLTVRFPSPPIDED